MFKRILIATDGSENASHALDYAAELARIASSEEVVVIHVCIGCTADLDPDERNLEAANGIAADAAEKLAEAGVNARTIVETDYPPESVGNAIIDTAKAEDVGLIVLGSRGLAEFKGMLLGSVSNKVVHGAECPVMVVKEKPAAD